LNFSYKTKELRGVNLLYTATWIKGCVVSYYLLIVRDHICEGKLVKAREIFEDRVKRGIWGLGRRAAHVKHLKRGDRVVFYVGGKGGGLLAGCGTLSSEPYPITEAERKGLCLKSGNYTYLINISDVEIWSTPIPIRSVCNRLSFIANKEKPHVCLQGAVRKISEEDYQLILEASK
jgi:predicted RNA-binding protein